MIAKTSEDIYGYEYDWLACDKLDRIALLSTAGGGYAPRALLADTDAYDQAIEVVLKLPTTCFVNIAPQVAEGLPNIWKQVAERGIYAFDSDALGGSYRIVSIPCSPIHINELAAEVASVVKRIKLSTMQFNMIKEISKSDIIQNECL